MADFIPPVFDILTFLCGYCSKFTYSIRHLGDNLNSLRDASNQLNYRYLDVKMKVEAAQQDPNPELTILNEVRGWMVKVEGIQNEVQAILIQGGQQMQAKCFGGLCPKNCQASYELNKVVVQKLTAVNDLIGKRIDVVAEKFARYDQFDELPVDKAVGVESTFEELCSCFQNNQVGIIGLYGMGGVGKTTLLRNFNNDFLSRRPYDVVIWVWVSKDVDPGKIQDDIRKKLRVQDYIWNNKTVDDRALLLYNILIKKKFVLLLDDVWGRIDLVKLGVPSPNTHECKIIFTTRSNEICGLMDAKRHIKVKCLTPDKAFELFKEKAGLSKEKMDETTFKENILPLVYQLVDECQGLPVALCVVGRVMANKTTPNEWKRAVKNLRSYPSKFPGIVEDVYSLLESSYDRLPNSSKSCFLYCALFLEDYIPKEDLILLWIAEGLLAEFDHDIHEAHKQGEDIISSLMYACLLENGEDESTIKMHDVIRDMALWVACDHGIKTRFLVIDCSVTSGHELYNLAKWKEVERLSMLRKGRVIEKLSRKPHCPNLITLLIRGTVIQVFPTEVFVLPSTIRVLDLSYNERITDLPSAIGDFVNLEHMNLSDTGIIKLLEELKNLKKLRFLLLNGLDNLEFPQGVVSSLSSLQAFSMIRGGMARLIEENVLLHELEGLDHLQDIRIRVFGISSIEKILISSKLQRCMCELFVEDGSLHRELFSSTGKMERLETLQVVGKVKAADIPKSSFRGHEYNIIILRKLIIWYGHGIVDLNWLIHAPNLEFLELVYCNSLVEVISDDFVTADRERVKSNLFSRLTYLHLRYLTKLKSICRMALRFPCLKEIDVQNCPNLEKLPFNSQSALKNLQHFRGDSSWMDRLKWEDEAIKPFLLPIFRKSS